MHGFMSPNENFIYCADEALPRTLCEQMIRQFDSRSHIASGQIGQGIDPTKKDSSDLCISEDADWTTYNQRLIDTTLDHLAKYIREYPFLICGPLTPTLQRSNGEPFELSHENVDELSDSQLRSVALTFYRTGLMNVQKYNQGHGGYHHWHSEIHPRESNCETLHRVLLFMYFLNDVEEGGQTDFFYQEQKVNPRSGRIVIAPAGFTHTHKGHIPISADKYIVTSWILFNRAEQLFAVA